ncbi:MAG: HD domain-containing protein [Acidimicrobiia bacterium]|nr:HD domain-containing protein [Acidimicrobiia bacterium]
MTTDVPTMYGSAGPLEQPRDLESHGIRTARIAVAIAETMDINEEQLRTVALAARIHDIGKMQIDPMVLGKPGPLDADEWVEMRRHPQLGYDMVKDWVDPKIARVVLMHHERLDGTGYPNGRTAEDIDTPTRILHVADAFDAITSVRPYQPALPVDHAINELVTNVGTQFDGDAVQALITVISYQLGNLDAPLPVRVPYTLAAVS